MYNLNFFNGGKKMNIPKNLRMKVPFIVFALVVVIAFMGVASASLQVTDDMLTKGPSVIESGDMFNGPTALQDAIDQVDTADGYHIQVETGYYNEQINVSKDLTLTGTSLNPNDTVIESTSVDGTVIVPEGRIVVLENLAICNVNVYPIINNGLLTLINCRVNDEYYVFDNWGTLGAVGAPETITSTETMPPIITEFLTSRGSEFDLIDCEGTTEFTGLNGRDTQDTGTTGDATGTSDPGIPLASLASGMLMVMGGTVVSKRE
jgi:hypothetical protein